MDNPPTILKNDIPPPEPGLSLTQNQESNLVAFVREERWGTSRDLPDRKDFEERVHTNSAFFEGKQVVRYDSQQRKIISRKVHSWEKFIVSNRTFKWLQGQLPECVGEQPQWHGMPGSDEEQDKAAARFAERMLQWMYVDQEMDTKMVEIWMHILVRVLAFVKVTWNPMAGPIVPMPSPDGSGQQVLQPLGNIDISVCDPLTVYPDPNATRWQDVRNYTEVNLQHIDWVRERWGIEVSAESDIYADLYTSDLVGRFMQQFFDRFRFYKDKLKRGGIGSRPQNLVRVFEYWELPSLYYPQGRYVVVANNKVMEYRAFPYIEAYKDRMVPELPYTPLYDSCVPWMLYPFATIDNVVMLNNEYNELRTQRMKMRELGMTPPLLSPRGANIGKTAYRGAPREIIDYDWPQEPKPMQPAQEPPSSIQDVQIILRDLEDVSNDPAIMSGRNAPNVRTWGQMEGLIERSTRKRIPSAQLFARGLSRIGMQALTLVRRYMMPQHQLYTVGAGGEREYFAFDRSLLSGNYDIRVQAGSALAREKKDHRDIIFSLMDRGFFQLPYELQERIAQMLNVDNAILLQDPELRKLKDIIAQENDLLLKGQPIPARPSDNHMIHLRDQGKLQEPVEYLTYPPQVQMVIEMHLQQHAEALRPLLMPELPETSESTAGGNGKPAETRR